MLEVTFFDFLRDLSNPALEFLPRALTIAVIIAVVCGVVGTHVVLRGMAFIGDAISHAVFPGLAIAFALQTSVLVGGALSGAVVALLIAAVSQRGRIKEDSIIGVFFAASFALGLVIISRVEGYTASLTSFLFGSITGVSSADIILAAVVGTIIVALILAFQRELCVVTLDRESARAMRVPVWLVDTLLYLAVAAAVVIAVRVIGNVLVLALLVTPAATARLLSNRLPIMMSLAVALGIIGCVVGLYLSWAADLPTGATIVLTLSAQFVVTWALTHGVRT